MVGLSNSECYIMNDIQKSLDSLHDKIDKLANIPFRVKLLERVIYGAIGIILIGFLVSLMPVKNNKVVAINTPIVKGIK